MQFYTVSVKLDLLQIIDHNVMLLQFNYDNLVITISICDECYYNLRQVLQRHYYNKIYDKKTRRASIDRLMCVISSGVA